MADWRTDGLVKAYRAVPTKVENFQQDWAVPEASTLVVVLFLMFVVPLAYLAAAVKVEGVELSSELLPAPSLD